MKRLLVTMMAASLVCLLVSGALGEDGFAVDEINSLQEDINIDEGLIFSEVLDLVDVDELNIQEPITSELITDEKTVNDGSGFIIDDNLLVEYIGDGGEVIIPNGVTIIGERAFYECDKVTSVVIPSGVVSIGRQAFMYCSMLSSITIPDSLTHIGDQAFFDCKKLDNIDLPTGLTDIGNLAFEYCSSLSRISIPDSVNNIGTNAFEACTALTSVSLGNGISELKDFVFLNCFNLININVPYSVKSIGRKAFGQCTSLQQVVIPNGINYMGLEVFANCSALETCSMPGKFDSPNIYTIFDNCISLKNITINGAEISDGVLSVVRSLDPVSITVSDTILEIKERAFSDCKSLSSVVLGEGITTISKGLFSGCSGLREVNIPNKVKTIADGAFSSCTGLVSIDLPPSVCSIGRESFSNCTGLIGIKIPKSVTEIGEQAFANCEKVTIFGKTGSYAETYAEKNGIPFEDPNRPKPDAITLTQGKTITLYMGNKLTLKAKVTPQNAKTTLKWTSSKPKVAMVSSKGVVTPKKAGNAKITVKTDNGKSATITVNVVDVKSVKLKEGKAKTLKVGKKLTLHAIVSPAKVKSKLSWTSSNKKVATVTSKGVVKAIKAGKAKIIVKTKNGKTASITVTVK